MCNGPCTTVPGLGLLLPIAVHLGSDSGKEAGNTFAHTTVHHIPNESPYLWAGPGLTSHYPPPVSA